MKEKDAEAHGVLPSIALLLLCVTCGQVLGAKVGLAQTNLETNAGVQFNFSTPGAGNLALGGAFMAIADDATAAYSNPAGLTNIIEPEVHIEGRSWRYTHLYTDRGRLDGKLTDCPGLGAEEPCPDNLPGPVDGEAADRVWDVSFVSYVYPRSQWSIAIYRHKLASFEANFRTQGAYLTASRSRDGLGYPDIDQGRLASLDNRMSLDIVNYGFSTAYRFNRHSSVGLGVSYYEFDLDSTTKRFIPDLFRLAEFDDPAKVTAVQTQQGDDSDWALNLGFLWESLGQLWSVGGVYRQGPEFDFRATSDPGERVIREIKPADKPARFRVPEVYGLGLAYRPTQAIRVTFDWVRVEYHDLMRSDVEPGKEGRFVDIFGLEEFEPPRDPQLEKFTMDDADELRLGFEYFFYYRRNPFSLRIGAWYEANHNLRYEETDLKTPNKGLAGIYPDRDGEMHYTGGFGLSWKWYRFDMGYDYSERFSAVSASVAFRFKRTPKRRPMEE